MPNRFAIEGALERGHLWAAMRNGRWWRLRRNGHTKLWKTRPDDFRVPVKAGLRAYGAITHTSVVATTCEDGWRAADFVVSANDPNTCKYPATPFRQAYEHGGVYTFDEADRNDPMAEA